MTPLPGEKFARQAKYERRHPLKFKPLKPRYKKLTRHHNVAQHWGGRGNGYRGSEDYLSMLTAEHHALFHKLFGLRTYREAAEVLLRLDKIHTQKAA
jgi:hypothetical protein